MFFAIFSRCSTVCHKVLLHPRMKSSNIHLPQPLQKGDLFLHRVTQLLCYSSAHVPSGRAVRGIMFFCANTWQGNNAWTLWVCSVCVFMLFVAAVAASLLAAIRQFMIIITTNHHVLRITTGLNFLFCLNRNCCEVWERSRSKTIRTLDVQIQNIHHVWNS